MEPGNQVAYNTRSARKRRAQSPEITTGKALEETKVLEHKRKVTKKTKLTNEEESTTTEEEKVIEKTVVVKKKAMEVETVEKTVKRGRGGSKKAEDNKSDEVVKSTSEEKSAKKGGSSSETMEVEDEKKTKKGGGSKKADSAKEDEDEKEKSSKKKDKKTKEKKEEKSNPKKRSKSTKKGKKGDDSDDEEDEDKKEKTLKKKSKSVKKGKKDDDSDDEDEDKKKPSKKRGKSEKKKKSGSESESEDEDKEKKGKKGWKKWGKSWKKGKKDNDDESGEKKKRTGRKMNRNRAEMVGLLEKYTPVEQTLELGDGKIEAKEIVISSWNVNGLCTILKYTTRLQDYVKERKPDILCLNETKLSDTNIKGVGDSWIPEGYYGYFNCCKIRKWYSGTAIISKHKPISVKFDIGIDKHGLEGRTITLEFENFYLVSTYVPNSGGHLVGVDYRVKEWDPDLRNYLNDLKTKKHVIVCGDLNVVHEAIDIYNIENKEGWPGVSPGERKEFGELLNSGFVDTFRHLYPNQKQFSFYCKKLNHRPKNLGWRLDYFLVDKDGLVGVKDSLINNKIYGSDHVPIELVLNPEFK